MIWESSEPIHHTYCKAWGTEGSNVHAQSRKKKQPPSQTLRVRSSDSQFHWHTLQQWLRAASIAAQTADVLAASYITLFFFPCSRVHLWTDIRRSGVFPCGFLCVGSLQVSQLTATCRSNDENATFLFVMWIYMAQRWTCNFLFLLFKSRLQTGWRCQTKAASCWW